jgi:thiamine biosynthesis lipoprotein
MAHAAFEFFRDFDKRFSRFQKNNELWRFNMSEGGRVTPELFAMLQRAKEYYRVTKGVFDSGMLDVMETTGYAGAYEIPKNFEAGAFSQLRVTDARRREVRKPRSLLIDLGGIGKGFAADKVARFLHERFANVLVDAGGDIAVYGANIRDGYDFWAIEVEHPVHSDESVELLMLSNGGVATSGRNRKCWTREDGVTAHHLIDPARRQSASGALLSVTVVAKDATEADVWAKTLFIMGKEKGLQCAETLSIPALFTDCSGASFASDSLRRYVWRGEQER